ncbi:glycosyltransferase [Marinobacter lacisalsi]|uniref:Glycosyltransferase n=1 Tax=Marinobacter lacisalsi TaxID=475979 RepID=A0ABV8QHD5_9GAMM
MKSPLRVLQFITPAGFYGAERWVLALARNVDAEAVVCDLAVTREGPEQDLTLAEFYPTDQGQQIHYLEMSGRFDFRAIRQLCKVIRDRNIDVIHTHGYKSDIMGLIAARRSGIACISTPHGFPGNTGWKMGAFIRMGTHSLRYFDRVVPLSEELMSDVERFGVPLAKTCFVRNGVDLTEIDDALETREKARMSENSRTVGFIGQMIPRKGLADLLAIFDGLFRNDASLSLRLVGDGNQRAYLEDIASSLNSREAISFLGFRSDRLELLASMDVFVMTSSLEGIPRCLMEAMAVGVPVVAYDIPGVDQLVTHGETGMLAPLGDKVALQRCCQQVLEDQNLANTLAVNGRRLVEEKYSAARMAREYESLFNELVSGSGKSLAGSGQVS